MFNSNFVFHLLLLVAFFLSSMQALSQMDKRSKSGENGERKLSRKRRYLIFPTGSSIQLVYDSTITIPDYTLYVTNGITVALAYGLPDKPTYPERELMEQYEDGRLPLLIRNDENATESNGKGEIQVSATPSNQPSSMHPSYNRNESTFANQISNYYKYLQRRKPDSYYFGNSPLNSAIYDKNEYYNANRNKFKYNQDNLKGSSFTSHNVRPPYSATFDKTKQNDAFIKYMSETYFKPWIETSFSQMKSTTIAPKTTTKTTEQPEFKPVINKLHTVYPAIGKRSIRDKSLGYAEKFFIDHHRNTRHKLYEIIEKYLFAKGYNGTECVLKTLCEVGQKQHENEPGSFLAEIVRVVFSLPTAQLQRTIQKRHIDYDDAHQSASDCMAKFPFCPDSIWTAGFLIESDAKFINHNDFQNIVSR